MLSIGAMGGGQAGYYVGLAREDYYHGGGEPPGKWHGQGAKDLGLSGVVDADALHHLFEGFHPKDDRALIQNAGAKDHQPGWDLTFSAPKSVSVLWSQADSETRKVIQKAHYDAVKAALSYIEAEAAITRRGKGGHIKEPANLIIATFEHGTSRAQDPQLHTHCLVMNVCTRADKTSGTMESKPLYQAKMTAGALYRAEYAALLEQRLDLSTIRKGSCFEIDGVSQKLMMEFSKRRVEIEAMLDKKGYRSAEASAVATLATRQVKGHAAREELFGAWQETGERLGWGREEAEQFLTKAKAPKRNGERGKAEMLSLVTTRITEPQSYFTKQDFIRCLAEEAQGRGFGASRILVVGLAHLSGGRDIVALGNHKGEPVYSTREMMALEAKLLRHVEASRDQHSPGVSETVLAGVIASRSKLPEEQANALHHLCEDGPGTVRIVSGTTKTEKATLLDAARFAWTLEGFAVHGAALSGKSIKGLQDGARIPSEALDKTLKDIETGVLKLHARSVLVVDEASRIDTRPMQRLVAFAQNAGARLVLIEGAKPSQPTEAVGPFKAIETRLGAATLSGLTAYARRGLLFIEDNKRTACEALIAAWKVEGVRAPEEQRIFAGTRDDVAVLNRMAQGERKKNGALGHESVSVQDAGETFYVGDRVVFTKKSRLYGVENGSIAEVVAVDRKKGSLSARLESGERATVVLAQYPHVRLGYAATDFNRQKGPTATIERAFVLTSGSPPDRERFHLQSPRARGETRIFTDRESAGEELTRLVRNASGSRRGEIAEPKPQLQPSQQSILPAEDTLRRKSLSPVF